MSKVVEVDKYYEMQFVIDVDKEVPAARRFATYTIDCFAHIGIHIQWIQNVLTVM